MTTLLERNDAPTTQNAAYTEISQHVYTGAYQQYGTGDSNEDIANKYVAQMAWMPPMVNPKAAAISNILVERYTDTLFKTIKKRTDTCEPLNSDRFAKLVKNECIKPNADMILALNNPRPDSRKHTNILRFTSDAIRYTRCVIQEKIYSSALQQLQRDIATIGITINDDTLLSVSFATVINIWKSIIAHCNTTCEATAQMAEVDNEIVRKFIANSANIPYSIQHLAYNLYDNRIHCTSMRDKIYILISTQILSADTSDI